MQPYPHTYVASAMARSTGLVTVSSPRLPEIDSASPPEFGGPEGLWSPESLLCAAVADCFVLTFRAVARSARLEWLELECRVEGTLERFAGVTQFTRFTTRAHLRIASDADAQKARRLLGEAEHGCLIANSLRGARSLEAEISTAETAAA
jgi:organic hydroperoxide reductase OsmC/OhrA